MKEWKYESNANSKRNWNNKCKNINCVNYDHMSKNNCILGKNHRTCIDSIKYKRKT